jgi:hypothetical protein
MNKEQQELLDEAYKNYKTYMNNNIMETRWSKVEISEDGRGATGRHYTQEEFINKCKTDSEFSETWGLKIEERELSDEESIFHYEKELYSPLRIINPKIPVMPTKLITIKYNDKTIESYE